MAVFPWESWESPLASPEAIRDGWGEQQLRLHRTQLKINLDGWEQLGRLAAQAQAGHVWGYRCISKKQINYCLITGFGQNESRRRQVGAQS